MTSTTSGHAASSYQYYFKLLDPNVDIAWLLETTQQTQIFITILGSWSQCKHPVTLLGTSTMHLEFEDSHLKIFKL
jgi:hypothetical protein